MTLEKISFKEILENLDLKSEIQKINLELIDIYSELEPIPLANEDEIQNIIDVIIRSNSEFFSVPVYASNYEKLVFILYSLTKSHFLKNGNKRMAARIFLFFITICIDDFLSIKESKITEFVTEIASKTIYIAESKSEDKERVISDIVDWLKKSVSNF